MPPFRTLDEEAEFWDTHDTAPLFRNPNFPLEKLLLLTKEKEESITIRVQGWVKDRLDRIARRKGLNTSTLLRMWFIEKLSSV